MQFGSSSGRMLSLMPHAPSRDFLMAVLKSECAAFVCTHSLLAPQGFLHALPETDECTNRGSRPNPEPLEEPLQQHSFSNVSNVKKRVSLSITYFLLSSVRCPRRVSH